MKFTEGSDEVLYTSEEITKISGEDVEILKVKAAGNLSKQVRLCAYGDPTDPVHEALIVHVMGAAQSPNENLLISQSPVISKQTESVHLIEGALKIVVFEDSGDIREVISLGAHATGNPFYHRITDEFFHTDIPASKLVVFHQSLKGPTQQEKAVLPSWVPSDDDQEAQSLYLTRLSQQLAAAEKGQ